jgi:ectoine hydroxylase-related dioxygenase (phytanoyl-CoA dioxygenase family)
VLDAALVGFERYYAGERDRRLPEESACFDWEPEQGETLKQNGYVSIQIAEVAALVRSPLLAASAARLLGSEEIRLFHDRLIVKPPNVAGDVTALGWHTDRAYWRTCTSSNMLTAWIPFQDTSADMGSLMVMDGSHRWRGNDWMATSHDRDLEALERRVSTAGAPVRKVAIELRRGQVSFHHCRTVHGSEPNRSRSTRMALAVHLQPAENRYQPVFNDNGRPVAHLNDLLCRRDSRGYPDYTDPDIFPRLWPSRADCCRE